MTRLILLTMLGITAFVAFFSMSDSCVERGGVRVRDPVSWLPARCYDAKTAL